MASGAGRKLAPITSKPMVRVAGRPLIDYSLREFEIAGVNHVAVTVRQDDLALRRHLNNVAHSGRFDTLEILTVESQQGASAAMHALIEHAGSVPQFISAADVVPKPGAYYDMSRYGAHGEPGRLISVIGYTLSPPNGYDKKWVYLDDHDDISVRDFGGGRREDHIEFAGVRWLDGNAREILKAEIPSYRVYDSLPPGKLLPISESQMQREMLPHHVLGVWMPDVVNVNTVEDIARAEQVVKRRVEPFFGMTL